MEPNNKKTDVENAHLSGPVKQVMQTKYKAHLKAGVLVQGKIESAYSFNKQNSIITFSENGTKVREELFGTDGNYFKTFNDKGREIESVHYMNGKLYQT